MKKFIFLTCCLFISNSAFSFENYIITSENKITNVENKTPDIIDVKILTTIMNEKNTVIVECKKAGKGEFVLTSRGMLDKFTVNSSEEKSTIVYPKGYFCHVLDKAPGVYELDPPPVHVPSKRVKPKGLTSIEIKIGDEED